MVNPVAEDSARERHERGEPYTVILSDPEAPRAYLDVRLEGGVIVVHFLDEHLRNNLTYVFTRPAGSRDPFFLEQVERRVYDESAQRTFDERYIFDPPDTVHISKGDRSVGEEEHYDVKADLTPNSEPEPSFGEYASIARIER